MIGALHRPGHSPLHRSPAGWKLAGLATFGLGVALLPGAAAPWAAFAVAAGLLLSTGVPVRSLARDLAWPTAIIAMVALATLATDGTPAAGASFARLAALLAAAHAVAVSTPTTGLLAAFERGLLPLQRVGLVDAGRAALTVSLAIRFIPVLAEEAAAIRRAQAARGLGANPVALAVPLVVRCLRRADALALALEARGWPPPPSGATPGASVDPPATGPRHAS